MKYTFQADIQELLNLIVHSFYSSKDIFLRELISNATDAINKKKHFDLQDGNAQGKYEIRISTNNEEKTLTITDNGIGMNKEDLEKNLSTIAKSGTKEFLKNVQDSKDQIGQFGVGFYSVYLVADNVSILTKKKDCPLYKWVSNGSDGYEIIEMENDENFSNYGTTIIISLKEDAVEYLEEQKIREVVKQHSNWVDFPVELYCLEEKELEINQEEEIVEEGVSDSPEIEESIVEELDESTTETNAKEPEKKTVKEWVWRQINETTPIWKMNTKDVKPEQYSEFYKTCFQEYTEPLYYRHFHTEGSTWDCHGIFFIPGQQPYNFMTDRTKEKRNVKLYVRKVLILDQLDKEMLPDWMNFVNGVVDCPDLPLNVSREMLQKTSILRNLKNQIQKQVKTMLSSLKNDKEKYGKFYETHGKNIKLGIHEGDESLLDYLQVEFDSKLGSLEEYVSCMQEGQNKIYYMGGDSDYSFNSILKTYYEKGYKVVLFREPIDEFMMQRVTKFKDFEFVNISKEHEVPWNSEDAENEQEKVDVELAFCKWVQSKLNVSDLENVKRSKSLIQETDDAGYIFSSKFGWTGNMEKLMAAQPLNDKSQNTWMKGKRILELNFNHPQIVRLFDLYENYFKESNAVEENEEVPKEEDVVETMKMIYNFTLLSSGFPLENPSLFAKQMLASISI
jgi:HSP90 family molecular chaperone